jgi:peptidyl-prolyl cis-trans isomerase SurA
MKFLYPLFGLTCACILTSMPGLARSESLRLVLSTNLQQTAQANQQRNSDFIVAIVNTEPITHQEVQTRLFQMEQQLGARGAAMPSRQALYSQELERLISERTQIQRARESGLQIDNQTLDNALQNLARQNQLDMDQFRQRLRDEGVDIRLLRNNLRDELLLQRIREREVQARVRITESELDAFIREQRDTPEAAFELNIAQILVAIPDNATQDQIKPLAAKAQRAAERAKAGEDFAALARELSDASDRDKGGELGFRGADRLPTLFLEATQNLASGAVTDPVRSDAGFHILKLLERRQQARADLMLSQTRVRHILLRTSAQMSESVARERLAQLRKRLADGLDFATAARENSHDGSAQEGGDLGWAVSGQFVPEFEQAMNALAPGQVSEPVTSRFGVHLIQVQERRERKMNEREQREAARSALREKKLEEAYTTWVQELRTRAYVELREQPF